VIGLVRSLARRLEQDKIRINALAPAVIGMSIPELSTLKTLTDQYRNEYRTKR
jgi:NAD(P)-dependent dehydrogenase (short-subunit alcohol dehydrogenase family)